ncbi:hypothetical protein GCM10007913_11540 [Devosia yakushimensis]|uniref:Uncharacterized protein n=1 Tax=Devosia yakushimensis TaxID=470028 RepID=A0ABQ5UD02_9HYPH|nr:hypothetical protein [Devosia yakushimensis]GLQ09222.1 hypothetical protein GCM10007913_11540 [Devosia yakushimensis]
MTARIIPLFQSQRAAPLPAPSIPAPVVDAVRGDGLNPLARQMVAAAVKSWMEGDPLTQREQRIVDLLLDTNYYGQLGRLAMVGC